MKTRHWILFAALLGACGGAPAPSDEPVASDTSGQEQPSENPGGECNFRVSGQCYDTASEACAAAGCDEAHCRQLESYPVQIQCETE